MDKQTSRINNPALMAALRKVRENENEQTMLEVLQEAIKASFILPVEGELEGQMSFHALTGPDGEVYQAVYADSDSFDKAFGAQNQNGIVAGFMDLAELSLAPTSKSKGFVINPGQEEILFKADMLKLILDQFEKEGVKFNTEIKVGDAQSYPDGMLDAIKKYGEAESQVSRIFVQLMQREGEEVPSWLFVLDYSGIEDREDMFSRFGNYIAPYLDGLKMNIIDYTETFSKQVCKDKTPIYSEE